MKRYCPPLSVFVYLVLLVVLIVLAILFPALRARAQGGLIFVPTPPAGFQPASQGVTSTQGVQGVQGIQGVQGVQGVQGASIDGTQVINVKTFTPPLSAFSAVTGQTPAQALASFQPAQGDNTHDDTAALQADLDYAVAKTATNIPSTYQRLRVVIPAGVYKLTSPLIINRSGSVYAGVDIEGAGSSPQGQPLEGGTTLRMTGVAQDSVIWVQGGSFRDNRIANLTLMMASDTHYGLHLGSQYSRLLISRVEIAAIGGGSQGTGVYQEYPTSGNANGEQTVLNDVDVDYCLRLFDFRSGQAFGLHLIDCGGQPLNGGTALAVGVNDNGGYQCLVENFSVSAATGTLPNTLFSVGVISGNFTAISTRSEKFDTVLALGGGSNGVISNVTLTDSHFDAISTHAALVTGQANSTQYFVSFLRNKFSSLTGGAALTIPTPGDFRHTVWTGCLFEQFAPNVSLGARPNAAVYPFNGYPGTTITDCWQFSSAAPVVVAVTN